MPDSFAVNSESASGASSGICPSKLQREVLRRHPDQKPETSQLTPFDLEEQRFYSQHPSDSSSPYAKAEPSHPIKEFDQDLLSSVMIHI
ncbi:hypothetical protein ILYODFUR_026179 [Ilyodon furcidens]|uniref:Uncharacterized protein n=1 Tax=Ilyodon furcidens TaxID=33524 RepID=A0ABV0ULG8_9TELE